MKLCTDCGLNYENNFAQCPACAGEMDIEAEAIAVSPSARPPSRPDGSYMTAFGWCAVIAGAFCALLGNNTEPTDVMGRLDPDELAQAALLLGAAEALLQLGVLMLLAGYIVRAMSFLPGKDDHD